MDEEEELSAVGIGDLTMETELAIISGVPREDLDLEVENGDLKVSVGPVAVRNALVRRLRTPLGAYTALYSSYKDSQDPNSPKIIVSTGSEYGSVLGKLVSEPLTNDWIRSFVNTLADAVNLDKNVTLENIELGFFDPTTGRIEFVIRYYIKGLDEAQSLAVGSANGQTTYV
jgi:hypothetical protein